MKLSGQPRRRRWASMSATISNWRRPGRTARRNSCVSVVGDRRGTPHGCELAVELMHEQFVEHRRCVAYGKAARRIGEPTRQKTPRRRREALIGEAVKPRADRAGKIRGETHRDARHFELGTLGVGGAVKKKLDLAAGR